ncbi:hypothetical protein GUJ93_ZPchr0001g29909 [Zizania palustris]|uniref:Uncharacterized protein n=1 Tax=Zizania palustris TaxID=103762 RepID=A0A8J5RP82_ZIZPA|nr:hypothetical protein GUJ93_ZPchr0001g29909 [Zizania palustris]
MCGAAAHGGASARPASACSGAARGGASRGGASRGGSPRLQRREAAERAGGAACGGRAVARRAAAARGRLGASAARGAARGGRAAVARGAGARRARGNPRGRRWGALRANRPDGSVFTGQIWELRVAGERERESVHVVASMAAAAAFSIRGYAASLRGGAAAEEARRPFGVEDLPPMEAPRFRWWADELAAAVGAGAPRPTPQPSRRAQAKAKAPKKRSMSDLFAAAPPLTLPPPADASGGNEATEEDDDEALCAIILRTKQKKRKRRLEEAAAAAATAAAAAVGKPESEGNFIREEAPAMTNSPDELDTPQASQKSESVPLRHPDLKRRKKVTINNIEKKMKNKKIDKKRYIQSKKANKVGKKHDLKKMLPLHSILKKYTKHTSVKMVKEKNGNTEDTEVIELCRKSVKRVKFAEVNDVLGINKQSSKRPQLQSLCKLFSDAFGSSSSSSTDMSSDGDKYIAAESSSHMPEKAFSKTKEPGKDTHHEDSLELTSAELSSNLIDLNEALPESTDFNYPYVSDSEEPNPDPTQHETLESDVQVIGEGRQNQEDLSFNSHKLACQSLPDYGLERVQNSVTLGTLLQNDLMEVVGTNIAGLPVKSTREFAEPHVSFNLNYGGIQLSTEGEVPPRQSQDHNASSSKASSVHSAMNVQQDCTTLGANFSYNYTACITIFSLSC